MENSNLLNRIWMMAFTFINATKKGFSASELQKQLGMKRYEPVLRVYHKLRAVMRQRDDRYRLEDMVEYDETYVGKSIKAQVRSKLKRGRGAQKQSKMVVMAESTVLEDPESGGLNKSCRYFKMKKIKNLEAKTAESLIKTYINSDYVLQTDESTTFSDLNDCIDVHIRKIFKTKEGNFNLKWVHIDLCNLKKHLQANLSYDPYDQ